MLKIQTLYVNNKSNLYAFSFGWNKPCYHWMSWVLSSSLLQQQYPKGVTLYTQKELTGIVDELQLPYHRVDVRLSSYELTDERLWALPKLYTYSLQQEPFLHIDGDVFLFQPFQHALLANGLIAQNEEVATDYYTSTQQQLMEEFTWFPDCVAADFGKPEPIRAVNAGIMGGCDIDFFQQYTQQAFQYVECNAQQLSKVNADGFNVFFEQHLFYAMAAQQGKSISYLFPDIVNDNQYQHLGEFHEVPCSKSYLHLLGHYKKDEATCLQMAAKLREQFPQAYERVIKWCHHNGMYHPHQQLYTHYLHAGKSFENLAATCSQLYSEIQPHGKESSAKPVAELPCVVLLREFLNHAAADMFAGVNMEELEIDFKQISESIFYNLSLRHVSREYLYGRDLQSQQWYCSLFSSLENIESKSIVCCSGHFVIASAYDWSRLYNYLYRVGVMHYEQFVPEKGLYHHLVVQEATDYTVSLYDLDEMEKLLLEYLQKPCTIGTVFKEMEQYMEEDVLQHHYGAYRSLVLSFIQQLVVKKAIKPC